MPQNDYAKLTEKEWKDYIGENLAEYNEVLPFNPQEQKNNDKQKRKGVNDLFAGTQERMSMLSFECQPLFI